MPTCQLRWRAKLNLRLEQWMKFIFWYIIICGFALCTRRDYMDGAIKKHPTPSLTLNMNFAAVWNNIWKYNFPMSTHVCLLVGQSVIISWWYMCYSIYFRMFQGGIHAFRNKNWVAKSFSKRYAVLSISIWLTAISWTYNSNTKI